MVPQDYPGTPSRVQSDGSSYLPSAGPIPLLIKLPFPLALDARLGQSLFHLLLSYLSVSHFLLPAVTFETGIRKTVRWYLDNQAWVQNVTSGAYKDWVTKQYQD